MKESQKCFDWRRSHVSQSRDDGPFARGLPSCFRRELKREFVQIIPFVSPSPTLICLFLLFLLLDRRYHRRPFPPSPYVQYMRPRPVLGLLRRILPFLRQRQQPKASLPPPIQGEKCHALRSHSRKGEGGEWFVFWGSRFLRSRPRVNSNAAPGSNPGLERCQNCCCLLLLYFSRTLDIFAPSAPPV